MNKLAATFHFIIIFSCQSIKKYNETLTQPISVTKLQSDVDYSYKKLKQLHPNYIGTFLKKS